jgi:nucleotide-binding universal stress UspA family protein
VDPAVGALLLVPATEYPPKLTEQGDEMYRSIVVGTDGSDTAARAVAKATELASLTGATLHVATVGGATTAAMLGDPMAGASAISVAVDETRDELAAIVEKAAEPARDQGVTVATHALVGSAAQALCDLAERVGADLLVVGNRGMQGGRRFLGSVPNTISHHAHCSVLIVDTMHEPTT